jgi:tripartite-type tricarboxylate transporter receptor subunit TctC
MTPNSQSASLLSGLVPFASSASNMTAILKTSVLLGLLVVASASTLHAAGYPDHPVKVIVPFPAGGVTDIATRVIAQRLSERLGQQFYIENIGGAGGNIGMADAARGG